jgi:hypothetical protein
MTPEQAARQRERAKVKHETPPWKTEEWKLKHPHQPF